MLLDLKIALASLSAHKLRAVLAMLGVFLGALSFNGVQHVAEAMYKNAEAEADKLGPGLFAVMAGQVRFSRGGGGARFSGHVRSFTLSDAQALTSGVPSVLDGAPFVSATLPVRSGNTTVTAQILATTPAYVNIRNFRPDMGRFIREQDVQNHGAGGGAGPQDSRACFWHRRGRPGAGGVRFPLALYGGGHYGGQGA
jgi:hypothetical protein